MDSYFEKGIKLTGTLWVKGDVHFNANIKGVVYSKDHFIIGPLGQLEGDVHSYNFSNIGELKGNVFAENKVSLMQESKLIGDISAYQLVIDEGSSFEGRCKMTDAPQEERNADLMGSSDPTPTIKLEQPQKGNIFNKITASKSVLKKASSLVIVGFIFILAVIFLNPKLGLKSQIETGYRFIQENRYIEAEAEFKKALGKTRNNSKVYAGLGEVYFYNKRYNEATSQFKRSIALKPSSSEYRYKLAKVYHAQGYLQDAESSYRSAIEEDS